MEYKADGGREAIMIERLTKWWEMYKEHSC